MYKRINLVGRKFHKLKVLHLNEELTKKYNQSVWHCVCDCGNETDVTANRLINDLKTDCGHCNDIKPGDVFDAYTVIEKDEEKSKEKGRAYYKVQCVCGNIRSVAANDLKARKTTNCGCIASLNKRDTEDITDQKFDRWTAKKYNKELSLEKGQTIWDCVCDCGNEGHVPISALKLGLSKSCGCLTTDLAKERAEQREKEMPYHVKLKRIHMSMIYRCRAAEKEHANYYDRNIRVCDRWADPENGFLNFYNDMISTYKPGLSLDRIDVNKGYFPENCRWISFKDQSYNKTTTRYHEYYGVLLCAGEIKDKFYNPSGAGSSRVNTRLIFGFTVDEALQIPVGIRGGKDAFFRKNPDFKIISKPFMFDYELEALNLTGRTIRYDLGEGKMSSAELKRYVNSLPTAAEYWGENLIKRIN